MRVLFFIFLFSLLIGCGDTGQERISYPVFASGVLPVPFQVDDWEVTLEFAEVGFGPAFFCATAAASADLCPVAVAEFADSATVDLLDPAPQLLGEVNGVTGVIQSTAFDYGISWFVTQSAPRPTPGAPGGHSLRLEGTAIRDTITLRFIAEIDVQPAFQGDSTVQGLQVFADVLDSNIQLDILFDPVAWVGRINFDELEAIGGDPVRIEPGMIAFNALVIAMTNSAPPTFVWNVP